MDHDRRRRWIAPYWAMTLLLTAGLYVTPFDVKVDRTFPIGIWMRTPVWGLPSGPAPRDHRGVPEYWLAGSCIVPRDPPRQVLVVGLGRWSHGADAAANEPSGP